MFIRELKDKKSGKSYLHIYRPYRNADGKPRQQHIASLGNLEKLKARGEIEQLAKSLLSYCQKRFYEPCDFEEEGRYRWGAVKVWKKVWEMLEMDKVLEEIFKKTKVEFDYRNTIFLEVIDRLTEPQSKLKVYERQAQYLGLERVELEQIYRSLDYLADSKEKIEDYLFQRSYSIINCEIDVVFYDVTSFYFESNKRDILRDFGFSKDGKVNEVQVVMGLLMNKEGIPIGFELFSGNTYEGKTLINALEKLRKRFAIGQVILVADKGINTKENLKVIKEQGYGYIIASRIKNLGKSIKEEILNEKGYEEVKIEEEPLKFKVIPYKNIIYEEVNGKQKKMELDENLIVSWSEKRANKDRQERERLVEKAKEILDEKGIIQTKKGALKYLSYQIDKPILNQKKIEDDAKWDGYYAIQTSEKNLTALQISHYYGELWRIEEAFRVLKSHLETRPIYHWTTRRIKGHFVLCFIAFLLDRTLQTMLKRKGIPSTSAKLKTAITNLEASKITVKDQTFYLRSKLDDLSKSILKTLKIKIPPNIFTDENLEHI